MSPLSLARLCLAFLASLYLLALAIVGPEQMAAILSFHL